MSHINTEPAYSPEVQQVFTPGTRVYREIDGKLPHEWPEGTYLGWFGSDELSPSSAMIDWDGVGQSESSFDHLRNLYR